MKVKMLIFFASCRHWYMGRVVLHPLKGAYRLILPKTLPSLQNH